jgi:tRNA nucleotidyltransferase (CCA-adding enzyme)
MGYDLESGEFLDPFDGRGDLDRRVLRHIDSKSFIEDPLRVYRGVQFCARFDLSMDDKTKELCKDMLNGGMLKELAKERVYEEIKKLLLRAKRVSVGFELLRELGILDYFPELSALIGLKQDPIWHPEGDVWIHTMMVVDEAAKLRVGDDRDDLILMFGSLCHDFGKPSTTEFIDGRIRSRGHEKAGVLPTKSFLARLTNESSLIDEITPIVANHLAPSQLFKDNSSKAAIRRLSTRVNISKLIPVAKADFFGRDLKEARDGEFKAGDWLEIMAKELEVENSKPKMILQGRDLISLGLKPSPKFKRLLDLIYELQLDGKVTTKSEAIKKVKELF